jgi:hypothetical protein
MKEDVKRLVAKCFEKCVRKYLIIHLKMRRIESNLEDQIALL